MLRSQMRLIFIWKQVRTFNSYFFNVHTNFYICRKNSASCKNPFLLLFVIIWILLIIQQSLYGARILRIFMAFTPIVFVTSQTARSIHWRALARKNDSFFYYCFSVSARLFSFNSTATVSIFIIYFICSRPHLPHVICLDQLYEFDIVHLSADWSLAEKEESPCALLGGDIALHLNLYRL